MEYEKLKTEIKEISQIAASVPEQFREKCFEILLQHVLAPPNSTSSDSPPMQPDPGTAATPRPPNTPDYPSHVKAFMRRQEISTEQMQNLIMLEGEELHFLKEPTHKEARRGQHEWALLCALRNGILNNSLRADPEEVRSLVQEKGFYDAKNFSSNFKAGKGAKYFKNKLEPQGQAQPLSQEGEKALAELIVALVS